MLEEIFKRAFDQMMHSNLSEPEKEALRKSFTRAGLSDEEADRIVSTMHLVKPGSVYGHAHSGNVSSIVERAIYRQNCQSLTLKISREGDEESYDGHLEIKVIEVEE